MNKRKHKRFIRRCETTFSAGGEEFRGISSDFSLAGMFIRTKNPFPPDTVLDIRVTLPDDSASQLTGLVRRASKNSTSSYIGSGPLRKNGMGVQLIETDGNYLDFLRSLIGHPQEGPSSKTEEPASLTKKRALAPKRQGLTTQELLIHLITTQQALINLLDSKGIINKRDIADEMKKLKKK